MAAEGIFEELDAAPGQLELKVRDSHGARVALLQFREDALDDELIADLERWHARKNLIRLTLVESSGDLSPVSAPASLTEGNDGAPPPTLPALRLG